MTPLYTAVFWKDAGERAVKTTAQALLSLWLVGGVFDVLAVDWGSALGVAGGAAVISLLTSVVSAPAADRGTASLVQQDHVPHVEPRDGPAAW
ncbi:holin [Pseudonocardia alni]|uniref:holin n=1 Tax=Pseudonocardia alni TaxID=33907 RepID=UPI0027A59DC4|nr:holin [Pseudonocardia alni]WFG47446.1 holin [Pseudonocardia alni]